MALHTFTKYCKAFSVCMALLLVANTAHAKKVRVLFIGNSYTYFNDLPKITADVAASTGDTLVYDMSAEPGACLANHVDTSLFLVYTLKKIRAGGWDYVVMQEQSQFPALPPQYYDRGTPPYAKQLIDSIKRYSPCAEPIFFMTWGRKNGDVPSQCNGFPGWLHFCTYQAMDSVIRVRYMELADSNKTTVSPVGAVWRYIRVHHPGIELYNPDGSHPGTAGSYAGACAFYTAIFKKPADSIKFNYSIPAADAAIIRKASTMVVYDSMRFWHIGQYETIARFTHTINGMLPVSFTNKSANAATYAWNFGDGNTSTTTSPTHTYTSPGTYTARLIATGANQCSDTTYATLVLQSTGITRLSNHVFSITPNPNNGNFTIKLNEANSSETTLKIYDMLGRQVHTQQVAVHTNIINVHLQHLPKGTYNIAMPMGNGMASTRLVIE